MKRFWSYVLLAVAAGVFLAGCCGPGGGASVETKNITNTNTLGEQLIDLQKAYESGAISESQYRELKEKTIRQNTAQ